MTVFPQGWVKTHLTIELSAELVKWVLTHLGPLLWVKTHLTFDDVRWVLTHPSFLDRRK